MTEETDPRLEQRDSEITEVIYDYMKAVPEAQQSDWKDLDTKIVQIFQAASIVMGLAGVASGNLIAASGIASIALIVSLAFYVLVAGTAFCGLYPRAFERVQASTLWDLYWDDTLVNMRHGLIESIGDAYPNNQKIIDRKGWYLFLALLAAGIEVVLVVLALILASFALA